MPCTALHSLKAYLWSSFVVVRCTLHTIPICRYTPNPHWMKRSLNDWPGEIGKSDHDLKSQSWAVVMQSRSLADRRCCCWFFALFISSAFTKRSVRGLQHLYGALFDRDRARWGQTAEVERAPTKRDRNECEPSKRYWRDRLFLLRNSKRASFGVFRADLYDD